MHNELCERLGIEFPIFAFSHCRDVVAAVTNAGGIGVLGALAFSSRTARAGAEVDRRARERASSYGVDVVIPASHVGSGFEDTGALLAKLQEMHARRDDQVDRPGARRAGCAAASRGRRRADAGADEGTGGLGGSGLLGWTNATSKPQVEVALGHDIKLLANALGPPPKDVVDAAHEHGVMVAALVGRARPGTKQVEQGVDIVIAQGTEAGGHTGEIATMVLVPQVVEAVHPTPVLAAGGIGSGRQMAAAHGARRVGRVDGFDLAGCRREQHGAGGHEPLVRSRQPSRPCARVRSRASPRACCRRNGRTRGNATTAPARCPCRCSSWRRRRLALASRAPTGGTCSACRSVRSSGSMDHVQTIAPGVLDMVQEYIETVEKMSGDLNAWRADPAQRRARGRGARSNPCTG